MVLAIINQGDLGVILAQITFWAESLARAPILRSPYNTVAGHVIVAGDEFDILAAFPLLHL
jgi:hypothetical protein